MKPFIAPIGLEYVGEYLKENGIDISVFDMSFQKDLEGFINKIKPDFIGMTIRNTDDCSYPSMGFFLSGIKNIINRIKKTTDCPVIAGGAGFSVIPKAALEYLDLDFGIFGDGEDAFLKFLKEYPDVRNVPNLVYRDNEIIKKNEQEFFNLKKLNPERQLFDNKRYFLEGGMGSFETKRGCTNNCIYCADLLCKGKILRLRKGESVAEEIKSLLKMGINYFHTCDSEFNIPYDHAIEVCKAIIKSKINKKIHWYSYCSAEGFDYELAGLMKQAGCTGINFGVDSGSDKILNVLKRNYQAKDLIRVGEICHKLNITFMYDLLLGGPEEDENTVKETIKVMKEIKPDVVGSAIGVRLYKGTYMGDIALKEGINKENENLYGNIKNNDDLLKPVFYISSKIGKKIFSLVEELTSNDKRFLFSYGKDKRDYNYNQNEILINAIKKGHCGAFWDILRKLSD